MIFMLDITFRKNGGEAKVDNIRPICSDCNLSMGSTNMDVFMEKYH